MAGRIADHLSAAARRLQAAGVENAAREAAWLLAHVLGTSVSDLRLQADRVPEAGAVARFGALVDRRADREPLQYILGTQDFLGLTLAVTPAVLIPRPDTEVLVRTVAAELERRFPGAPEYRVADIGTGSGCIAAGLCHLLPGVRVTATDVSEAALTLAKANIGQLGFGDRVSLVQGDLYGPLAGITDLHAVVANPPYIDLDEWLTLMPEVRDYEPPPALTPGQDGLAVISRLIHGARSHLIAGGLLALEVGHAQAAAAAALMAARGLRPDVFWDDGGHARCVIGVAAGAG